MKLVCISDTHGDHAALTLPQGDILIHAGDVSGHGRESEVHEFMQWLGAQSFAHKICVAGNHDGFIENEPMLARQIADEAGVILLEDSGCEVGGLSFWGSPITPRFFDWSFMRDPGPSIEAHWRLIPNHTDVLITHGPPHGILDTVVKEDGGLERAGCPSLLARVQEVKPLVHIFGHIHEGFGCVSTQFTAYHNVSTMDRHYRICNPVVVIPLAFNKLGLSV